MRYRPPSDPKNAIHVYRHLLREATYLPFACRPFVTDRIKEQFRRHRSEDGSVASSRIRYGNQQHRFLYSANAGDIVRMRKILLHTFGRAGRRRREKMAQLYMKDPPADQDELAEDVARECKDPKMQRGRDWLDHWNTARLLACAKSQVQQKLHNSPRPSIKDYRLDPSASIPALTVWGRSPSEKQAHNKMKKWWKKLAHRILPPITTWERDMLQPLATGKAERSWAPPPRRTLPPQISHDRPTEWQWTEYVENPVRHVDRGGSRDNIHLSGLEHDSQAVRSALGFHTYTPRLWRRLYAQIWQISATMEQRPGEKKWNISWGKEPFAPMPASPKRHAEFFEGVPDPDQAQDRNKRRGKKPKP